MLDLWYKEKRTLVDFRRGPLGPHFDGFAAHLKAKGFCRDTATSVLGKCCLFNAYLIDRGIAACGEITEAMIAPFLDLYAANTRTACLSYSPRTLAKGALKRLFHYLMEIGALKPSKPERIKKPYDWLLDPYLEYLRGECGFSEMTIKRYSDHVGSFLDALGPASARRPFKALRAEAVDACLNGLYKKSPENRSRLGGSLHRFFHYCAAHQFAGMDFSGLIPPVRRYRLASLPKGMEDPDLEQMLAAIDKEAPNGSRDYAIMVLMMAYGIRGISAAELLLDDIDWQGSRIRIRAQKGGKEVTLPLMDRVGDALIHYLRHRPARTEFREVFLTAKAPIRPLNSMAISRIVRRYMQSAGVLKPGAGSRTLRHSWAIRALASDSPIKAIADVLGHRCIDTTFIYAKADLKALREVAMPWPEGK